MRYEPEADLVEGTFAQRFRTRKESSQSYEDEENIRPTTKRKSRSRTDLVTPQTLGPPPRIFATNGSGTMVNENIGNIFNVTTSE